MLKAANSRRNKKMSIMGMLIIAGIFLISCKIFGEGLAKFLFSLIGGGIVAVFIYLVGGALGLFGASPSLLEFSAIWGGSFLALFLILKDA